MRHASGYNYRNSSFIVDVAMGQIPRSTERISSYLCSGHFMFFYVVIFKPINKTHVRLCETTVEVSPLSYD